ncbi:hypothetical protein [Moritella viscosa]|uniref:LPXTG-motif cell wall anchor domain protein n=1 Tax=Moritella viscosa TaxID=80854 RepID=A0A1L0CJG7_9GAMM|nr:hypothetical protein [Moritella viscosa]SGZ17372.1 LPXTG-motif cell wall anchor domain protein [Moritella viscosa]
MKNLNTNIQAVGRVKKSKVFNVPFTKRSEYNTEHMFGKIPTMKKESLMKESVSNSTPQNVFKNGQKEIIDMFHLDTVEFDEDCFNRITVSLFINEYNKQADKRFNLSFLPTDKGLPSKHHNAIRLYARSSIMQSNNPTSLGRTALLSDKITDLKKEAKETNTNIDIDIDFMEKFIIDGKDIVNSFAFNVRDENGRKRMTTPKYYMNNFKSVIKIKSDKSNNNEMVVGHAAACIIEIVENEHYKVFLRVGEFEKIITFCDAELKEDTLCKFTKEPVRRFQYNYNFDQVEKEQPFVALPTCEKKTKEETVLVVEAPVVAEIVKPIVEEVTPVVKPVVTEVIAPRKTEAEHLASMAKVEAEQKANRVDYFAMFTTEEVAPVVEPEAKKEVEAPKVVETIVAVTASNRPSFTSNTKVPAHILKALASGKQCSYHTETAAEHKTKVDENGMATTEYSKAGVIAANDFKTAQFSAYGL